MPNWNNIDTILLDMDGTLLDLHFDNYFWCEYLPLEYARCNGQEVEQVRDYLSKLMDEVYGSIDWYCVDFWTEKLDIDIISLKREIDHLIALRPATGKFLEAAHRSNKKVYMVTNAHHDVLELKLDKINISHYFDELISSHQYGYIKEQQEFWQKLEQELNFDPKRTFFIDDSQSVLDSAAKFGIAHIYSINQPDSKQPPIQVNDDINNDYGKYPMIDDFSDIIKGLN